MEECMHTYLRFTRTEYGAICRACRSIPLSDDRFSTFQSSLVAALAAIQPDLARRIADFRSYQVGILFQYVKRQTETSPALTAVEYEAVARVYGSVLLPQQIVTSFQDALVGYFGKAWPQLSDKLARLSEQEVAQLYEQVSRRRG
jgi:hypothetical protein